MEKPERKSPNIIFILSDDQGPWALGCTGNPEIRTPNLDKLAAEGLRFENFFCTSPVCSAARATLLTGKIPSQHGVHDWIREGNYGDNAIEYLTEEKGYTDIMSENGYTCGISGKWHLGKSQKARHGFSHWYVHQKGSGHYYQAPMIRDEKLVKEERYITDLITDDAISFMKKESKKENPFYLSVHYTAPHGPWINEHPEEIVESYQNCDFNTCPQDYTHPDAIYRFKKEDAYECLKGYFAAVTAMDKNIGRIIKKVEELGIRENTLICFLSDNGFNCGHHGIWGKGNGTLPLNMYDTSVKVPAIFSHPGKIPRGEVNNKLVSGYDMMPTLLDYIDLEDKDIDNLPGESFVNLLLGLNEKGRENVVIYDEYGPTRMIRTRDYKYIHRYPEGPHEFYDLKNDPGEENNLIDSKDKKAIITF
ncbi:MAG: sulfatase-like hydrolase/transferase, partial [Halanaerobiales bacterium]